MTVNRMRNFLGCSLTTSSIEHRHRDRQRDRQKDMRRNKHRNRNRNRHRDGHGDRHRNRYPRELARIILLSGFKSSHSYDIDHGT